MNTRVNKVSVIGMGYIGLPTAVILANRGITVAGIEINHDVVETLKTGKAHIAEPDLDILVNAAINSGGLEIFSSPVKSEVFIIAVPTPFKDDDHKPDLSFIEGAVKSIAPFLEKNNMVILESTSPVGTTENISKILSELRPDLRLPSGKNDEADIYVAYCPERVLPGKILHELVENDRIIGGISSNCSIAARKFYELFVNGNCITTNSRTAEMTKLTENAFRDVNIAFANELSMICDKFDIDVWDLIDHANRHPRVNILQPGPGVGGHCIAVDPWFIVSATPEESRLIRTSREVNDYKSSYIVEVVKGHAKKFNQPIIACLGLTFKADIDDVRESPALKIVKQLSEGTPGSIIVFEPHLNTLPEIFDGKNNIILGSNDIEAELKVVDIVVILVDHNQFKSLNFDCLKEKIIVDTKGLLKSTMGI